MWGDHTLMYNLMKQHALPQGVFAFYMADDGSGYLTIGRGTHPPYTMEHAYPSLGSHTTSNGMYLT